jgi:hypothetical protein
MAESPHVRRIAALVVALAAIALPAPASASTVNSSGGVFRRSLRLKLGA